MNLFFWVLKTKLVVGRGLKNIFKIILKFLKLPSAVMVLRDKNKVDVELFQNIY